MPLYCGMANNIHNINNDCYVHTQQENLISQIAWMHFLSILNNNLIQFFYLLMKKQISYRRAYLVRL